MLHSLKMTNVNLLRIFISFVNIGIKTLLYCSLITSIRLKSMKEEISMALKINWHKMRKIPAKRTICCRKLMWNCKRSLNPNENDKNESEQLWKLLSIPFNDNFCIQMGNYELDFLRRNFYETLEFINYK